MARIRTIKPEFWTDERVGECSVSARLLFVACWNFSDDHGGLDRSAKQLKAQAFPYDSIDCEPLVQELLKAGLLIEYTVAGKMYLHIRGFRTHQKVEKPAKPRVPVYDDSMKSRRVLPEESPSPPLLVAVSSLEGNGKEGKGREGNVRRAREEAWQRIREIYPKGIYREADWLLAERSFGQLVDQDADPGQLADLVALYQAQQTAKQAIGSQYVLSPSKFFTENRWRGPFPLPATKADARLSGNVAVMQEFVGGSQ